MKKSAILTEQEFNKSGLSKEEVNNRINSMGLSISEEEIGKRINNAVLKLGINVNCNVEYGYLPTEEKKFYDKLADTAEEIYSLAIAEENKALLILTIWEQADHYRIKKEQNKSKQSKIEKFSQLPFFWN